jgi:hypothetical protein
VTSLFLFLTLLQAPTPVAPEVKAKTAHLFAFPDATIGPNSARIEYWLDGPSHQVQLFVTAPAGTRALQSGMRRQPQ